MMAKDIQSAQFKCSNKRDGMLRCHFALPRPVSMLFPEQNFLPPFFIIIYHPAHQHFHLSFLPGVPLIYFQKAVNSWSLTNHINPGILHIPFLPLFFLSLPLMRATNAPAAAASPVRGCLVQMVSVWCCVSTTPRLGITLLSSWGRPYSRSSIGIIFKQAA